MREDADVRCTGARRGTRGREAQLYVIKGGQDAPTHQINAPALACAVQVHVLVVQFSHDDMRVLVVRDQDGARLPGGPLLEGMSPEETAEEYLLGHLSLRGVQQGPAFTDFSAERPTLHMSCVLCTDEELPLSGAHWVSLSRVAEQLSEVQGRVVADTLNQLAEEE